MELLNPDLVAIDPRCLKWYMRLALKQTKYTVVNRSRTYAPGYGDLTVDGVDLEEVKSRRILEVIFDSKYTFETHLRKVA